MNYVLLNDLPIITYTVLNPKGSATLDVISVDCYLVALSLAS